ncbi:Hypothetical protein ORPV_946 [Orpheovirus IHUMI-LCC2]|uniref:Uncharacterized protein n=1 Tax=Orpheovirus IHUMI-LCC2 TaxID=2023057 RepID=A0A2I2L5S6_9VIRU|nr:Hypothetical protein ORPV_946 [Orpheovirus IHUMI-LCC2]SNW62850.1 Hypothetical protein ORPV_946 [Orpheovirus IHUMI-LCC2]
MEIIIVMTLDVYDYPEHYILTPPLTLQDEDIKLLYKELQIYNNQSEAVFNGLALRSCYANNIKNKSTTSINFKIFSEVEDNEYTEYEPDIFYNDDNIKHDKSYYLDKITLYGLELAHMIIDKWDANMNDYSLGYELLPYFTKYVIHYTSDEMFKSRNLSESLYEFCRKRLSELYIVDDRDFTNNNKILILKSEAR